jgi:hypothetical protein
VLYVRLHILEHTFLPGGSFEFDLSYHLDSFARTNRRLLLSRMFFFFHLPTPRCVVPTGLGTLPYREPITTAIPFRFS